MHIYRQPPETAVKSLLAACNLPTADLESGQFEHFFGCGSESTPAGVVGIQIFGSIGLLRSLAVAEAARNAGCGRRLVVEAEAHAVANGVSDLYLLTTTAESYFRSLGYTLMERSNVPEAIRRTQEFSSLCPASSVLMVKRLGG